MTSSPNVPPIAEALAPFVAIFMAGIASLAIMDLAGLNVGVCVAAFFHCLSMVALLLGFAILIGLVLLCGVLCVGAVMGGRR